MAGEGDLLTRVRTVAALLDDVALAALASKGLVRRARRDAEQAPPRLLGEVQGRIRLEVESQTVELAERPADARCTCPARGICRHVLAALIHLGRSGAPAAPADEAALPGCGAELLVVSDEELRRWAGSAALRRAVGEAAAGPELAFQDGAPFVARLPAWNVECRWIPGGGLDGMLCSCHASGPCLHKLVAIVAWQARSGRRDLAGEETVLAEAAGAPRTRQEVRASVQRTLEELVALGLSRLSPATEGRLRTLATSAHGVDLPRLERLLRAVADEISAWLRREARASSGALLARAAQAAALADALAAPTPSLVGRHRARYDRVGELELVGLGARAWRSASGFAGLTLYFWDVGRGAWATWTEARPQANGGFDPADRFRAPGPWTGCASPAKAASAHLRLLDAWRSAAGRLSGRESTRMLAVGPAPLGDVPLVKRWPELVDRAWAALGPGLGEHDELAGVVVLAPAGWGQVGFDELRQELVAEVIDAEGRALPLVLRQADGEGAIRTLEAAARGAPPPAVLGLLRIAGGRLAVEPVSLATPAGMVSLGLAASGATLVAPRAGAEDDEAEESELDDDVPPPGGELGRLLLAAWAELERLAEAGGAAWRHADAVAALAERTEAAGLATVATALRRLAEAGRAPGEDPAIRVQQLAHCALRAAYVVRACETAVVLEAATAGFTPFT